MKRNDGAGFTLIELMIVVAIIGLLAAIAIPAYQDYLARAQMAEAVELMAGAKTPMAEFYGNNGRWPAEPLSVMGVTDGRYVSNITMDNASGTSESLTLTATMKASSSSIASGIAGKTVLMLTTNGGTAWTCSSGTIAGRYLPGACH